MVAAFVKNSALNVDIPFLHNGVARECLPEFAPRPAGAARATWSPTWSGASMRRPTPASACAHAASGSRRVRRAEENGAQGRNRTSDTAIFSRMLYQLSYLGTGTSAGPRM